MIKEWLSANAQLNMEMLGLVIFVVVFAIINLWVFRKSGKSSYENQACLPLLKEKEL
ncbi:MAG: cbb3-type cytochrome c oxidase subunit 3 [Bdellovibrionota bacterium]